MLLAVTACLAVLALACGTNSYEEQQLALLPGWTDGAEVQYYDLGSNTPVVDGETVAIAPVWVLVYGVNEDGSPDKVPDQRSIFDVNLGEPGYTDLWQMVLVTVPEDYEADSIRSGAEVDASGFAIEVTDAFVNCPFVDKNAALEGGEQVNPGWVDGEKVYYLDFGPTSDKIGRAWVLSQDGSDGRVIFDDADGTDFRKVSVVDVPDGVDISDLRSADDIDAAGLDVETTATVLNQPIVEDATAPPASQPDGGDATRDRLFIIVFAIIALGAIASLGALAVSRARSAW